MASMKTKEYTAPEFYIVSDVEVRREILAASCGATQESYTVDDAGISWI